jgi:hypothetical protein
VARLADLVTSSVSGLLRNSAHVRKARSQCLQCCPGVAVIVRSRPPNHTRTLAARRSDRLLIEVYHFRMVDARYRKPEARVHRGFFYLNDETVINSLSAVEAGKVDEVLARVNTAREGGVGGGIGIHGAKVEGAKKSSSEFEEEMVRTRTRFSVFEIWRENLVSKKALGFFEGWSPEILTDVQPGETIEFKAKLELAPLQTIFRMFNWFAKQAHTQGSIFAQKGEELKTTKEAERVFRALAGEDENLESVVLAKPSGGEGPPAAMQLADRWMIGELGHMSGEYTVVGQVDQILKEGEQYPTLRIMHAAPVTILELAVLREIVGNFTESAKTFGLSITPEDATVTGPAVWLTPIAIYRLASMNTWWVGLFVPN